MMKILTTAALAACLALPAMAQQWDGTPLVNSAPYGGNSHPDGSVKKWHYACHANRPMANPILSGGQCSAQQLAAGAVTYHTNVVFDQNGNFVRNEDAIRVTSLPQGLTGPGSAASIYVEGGYMDPTASAGFSVFRGNVPLSAFASQSQVTDLNARIDAFVDEQRASYQRAADEQRLAFRGVALASSLSSLAPAAGKSNRIAAGMASFAGETAMSVNYSHQSGNFDFGLGVAMSSGDGLGKASVGFSW